MAVDVTATIGTTFGAVLGLGIAAGLAETGQGKPILALSATPIVGGVVGYHAGQHHQRRVIYRAAASDEFTRDDFGSVAVIA